MNVTPEQIVNAVPALAGGLSSLSIIDSGQRSYVFDFGTHIARVGRFPEASQSLARESNVLAAIGPLLPLPTPRIEIHLVAGTIVAVHEKLPGEPLMSIETLDPTQQGVVAAQLGAFLRALHGISLQATVGPGLPREDATTWPAWLTVVRTRLYPLLDDVSTGRFDALAVAFLDAWSAAPQRLRHGDLGGGNILVANGVISGIIDFGDVAIGDPASDIAGLIASYGDDFVDLVGLEYPEVSALRARAAFYRPAFAAMEAIHGLDHHDPDALAAGLATLREWNPAPHRE